MAIQLHRYEVGDLVRFGNRNVYSFSKLEVHEGNYIYTMRDKEITCSDVFIVNSVNFSDDKNPSIVVKHIGESLTSKAEIVPTELSGYDIAIYNKDVIGSYRVPVPMRYKGRLVVYKYIRDVIDSVVYIQAKLEDDAENTKYGVMFRFIDFFNNVKLKQQL